MVQEGVITQEHSTEKFLKLREKYINVPLWDLKGECWEDSGRAVLYPILRLFSRVIDAKHKYTRGILPEFRFSQNISRKR